MAVGQTGPKGVLEYRPGWGLVDVETGQLVGERKDEEVVRRYPGETVAYCQRKDKVLPIKDRPNWWVERG